MSPPRIRGFVTMQVSMMLAIAAVVIATSLVWQRNIRAAADRHSFAREAAQEEQRLSAVLAAQVRQSFVANDLRIYGNLTTAAINPLLTADPRFPGMVAGGPTTPGLLLNSLDAPGTPGLFAADPVFAAVRGASPLDDLRQTVFTSPFAYVMAKRSSVAADATLLKTRGGTVSLQVREIPITQFAVVATEMLVADSGITFTGPALALGGCGSANAASFSFRISPWTIPDAQIGVTERVWEQPSLAASLFLPPAQITDPSSVGPQQQNLARKGKAIYFDGQNLSCEGSLPQGIAAVTYTIGNVKRVVVNLGALPQTNVLIDSAAADVPSNRISAYNINCTSALARDRGVVIVGTASERQGDIVTTNGALILEGAHSGGPLLTGSTYGGVLVNNNVNGGNVTWNAFLFLPSPSPFLTATSNGSATSGARTFSIFSGSAALSSVEQGYDSLSLEVTPSSSTAIFAAGLGSTAMTTSPFIWVEGDATTLKVGIRTTAGIPVYTAPIVRGTGLISLTYSRSQNTIRLRYSAGTAYYSVNALTSERPRVETTAVIWSGSLAGLDVVSSAAGTVLGSTTSGTVQMRGLLTLGTVSRFGPASFVFSPSNSADGVERVVPRMIVIDR